MEGNILKDMKHLLTEQSFSSTVVHFSVSSPLPDPLVKTLVKARILEIENGLKSKKQ